MLRRTMGRGTILAFAMLLATVADLRSSTTRLTAGQVPDPASYSAKTQTTASHRSTRRSIDDRVKGLAKSLGLSETQEAQVKSILEQRRQQMLQIRHNTSISGSARIDQFRALQDETIERIRAVLNDQQKKKYDPLAARKLQQQQPAPSVEDWLEAARPH